MELPPEDVRRGRGRRSEPNPVSANRSVEHRCRPWIAGHRHSADSARASLPNRYCDPVIAARLYDEVFEEYELCDDLGLNIVTNEHHAGINNLYAASPLVTGIVVRITKKVRVLSLGTLITVRDDPVRIAEEYATADVISLEADWRSDL